MAVLVDGEYAKRSENNGNGNMIDLWQEHGMVSLPVKKYDHDEGLKHYILIKSCPVGQLNGIPEATAVGYRIINGIIQGEKGEKGHHQQQGPGKDFEPEIEQQRYTQGKFNCTKEYGEE